jgi:toxin FitB
VSGFLLDTNYVSELVRIAPDLRAVQWIETADERLLYLSVLTLGEIRKGLAGMPQGRRRTRLEDWLETDLQARFSGRILPIDWPVADCWGLITAQAKSEGFSLPIVDGLLAATAVHYNLTVVSRNTSDFRRAHVPVINPWNA